jgi:hypothetical protein
MVCFVLPLGSQSKRDDGLGPLCRGFRVGESSDVLFEVCVWLTLETTLWDMVKRKRERIV